MPRQRGFTLIELLIVVAIIAILAAIAVPALLRARAAANEAGAIGDVRSVSAAEASYASANGGAYGTMTCLNTPTSCGFATGTHAFVDSQISSLLPKQGYARSFLEGAQGNGTPDRGILTWIYAATPTAQGVTGTRGFAVDSTARVCQTTDGSVPPPANNQLTSSCEPLR